MDSLQYKIDVFEGPLDLLLALISKNKLDIYDIPIASLLEQYLEQIELMQAEHMDIASEFLDMAARLVYIKSMSLLPKHEEEILIEELTGQLIEYEKCKRVALILSSMMSFDNIVRKPLEIPADYAYKHNHDTKEILHALVNAMGKGKSLLPPKPENFSQIVSKKIVSIASQTIFLMRRLWNSKYVTFKALFAQKKDKSERVAAFLALLELIKGKRIIVKGDGEDMKISLLKDGEGH